MDLNSSSDGIRFHDRSCDLSGREYRSVVVDVINFDLDRKNPEQRDVELNCDVKDDLARERHVTHLLPVNHGRREDGAAPSVDAEHGRRLQGVGVQEAVSDEGNIVFAHALKNAAGFRDVADVRSCGFLFQKMKHDICSA